MEQTTIRDVARKSGYSVATVSRVLSGSNYPVAAETREAIERCARDLGYVPNMLARSLKTNMNTEVAVVIPSFLNPFYTTVLTGIERILTSNGFSMLVYLRKREAGADELIRSLHSKLVSGIIIAADCIDNSFAQKLLEIQDRNIAVIVFDNAVAGYEQLQGVFFDYHRGGCMAAKYLFSHGHRQVALISKLIDRDTRKNFANGFASIYSKENFALQDEDVYESLIEDDFFAGIELANAVLDSSKPYTAIAANNDSVAAGALSAMLQRGVRVPDDISIIGMDDNIYARMTTPLLTTVQIPSLEMGGLAARHLIDAVRGNSMRYNIYMQSDIIERNTVCNINK